MDKKRVGVKKSLQVVSYPYVYMINQWGIEWKDFKNKTLPPFIRGVILWCWYLLKLF